jgi:S-methylmethionine-dependent homocysteine/selenocysteine methylase
MSVGSFGPLLSATSPSTINYLKHLNMSTSFNFDRPLLLDGGNGRELLKRRVPILTHTWASSALYLAPDVVRQVHLDFIAAGADIITTNTYGLVRARMAEQGNEERFVELNLTAARLAGEAREQGGRSVAIAASLPPLTRSYRPDLVLPFDELLPLYREQVDILSPHVDLFICETMSSGQEALAAAKAAITSGKPVWVAWTLADNRSGRLRSGETIEEAAALLAHLPIEGFLANCSAPESVSVALPSLSTIGRGRFGAYANTFLPIKPEGPSYGDQKLDPGNWEAYEAAALPFRDDLTPEAYLGHARDWVHQGASIIGGCCGCGPEYIARLRSLLDSQTH